jgi:uncharacterized membrane protein YdfJ with MMPL/SSD domain
MSMRRYQDIETNAPQHKAQRNEISVTRKMVFRFLPHVQSTQKGMALKQAFISRTDHQVQVILRMGSVPRFDHGSSQNSVANEGGLNE